MLLTNDTTEHPRQPAASCIQVDDNSLINEYHSQDHDVEAWSHWYRVRTVSNPGEQALTLHSLGEFAKYMIMHGPRKAEATARRVRVIHNHTVIVDTIKAFHVWEHDAYPQYYIAHGDLKNCKLSDKQEIQGGGKTAAAVVELVIPSHDGLKEEKTDRVVRFAEDKSLGPLAGMVRLEFGSMGMFLARSW